MPDNRKPIDADEFEHRHAPMMWSAFMSAALAAGSNGWKGKPSAVADQALEAFRERFVEPIDRPAEDE